MESGGAIGLLVGLIIRVTGELCLCSYQVVSKRWGEGVFLYFSKMVLMWASHC